MEKGRSMAPIPLTLSYAVSCIIMVALGYWYAQGGEKAFFRYSREMGMVEWMGFLVLCCSSFGFAYLCIWENRLRGWSKKTWFFLGMAGLFLFGALEEVSFGQRMFELDVPQALRERNSQGELNLHNLVIGGVKLNKLIFGKILFVVVITHNILLPLLFWKKPSTRKFFDDWGVFWPNPVYVVIFALGAASVQGIPFSKKSEIMEAIGVLHYFVAAFSYYLLEGKAHAPQFLNSVATKKFAIEALASLVMILTVLSWLTGAVSRWG